MSTKSPGSSQDDGTGAGAKSSSPLSDMDKSAPLPSDVQPFPVACPCLNVEIAAYGSDDLVALLGDGTREPAFGERVRIWLPAGAETIRHMPMSTFDKDKDEAWRKCWVCDTRVYVVRGDAAKGNLAPINTWVEVNLTNGVLYGDKIDQARQRTPTVYSGLILDDLPSSSTFGRPPTSTTPVPYPVEPASLSAYLPPIPDPFFLPPPFIPNHPALREMCKAAVTALQARHDEIDRDIRSYIVQKAQDMRRLEDQVRAEVEALWDRYVQGPLGGQDPDRRGSIISVPSSRAVSGAAPPPTTKEDAETQTVDLEFERARSKDSLPSGVVPDPPSIGSQFNTHTATAAASLLSASIANNTFHAPPPRARAQDLNDIEELAKTVSQDRSISREVAMSYAFSTMEEHAGRRADSSTAAEQKQELQESEDLEEEAEEREKGIDSWAAMERSNAAKAIAKEVDTTADAKQTDDQTNAESKDKKPRAHVKFQEPSKEAKEEEAKEKVQGKDKDKDAKELENEDDDDDDDDYVFDMETDDIDQPRPSTEYAEQPEAKAPERTEVRSMVEDNLSRTFAAEAPSHRAAWRAVEERGLANVLRRSPTDDDDDEGDGDYSPADIGLARSVPVNIVLPARARKVSLERKTSLTDKKGKLVPGLKRAMREHGVERSAPRAIVGSLVKGGTGARRGSRSMSGEREREQVKSYAADPGAVFESLAEGAIDSESDSEATPAAANGKFVPPHVLAQRADKNKSEGGWKSVAQ